MLKEVKKAHRRNSKKQCWIMSRDQNRWIYQSVIINILIWFSFWEVSLFEGSEKRFHVTVLSSAILSFVFLFHQNWIEGNESVTLCYSLFFDGLWQDITVISCQSTQKHQGIEENKSSSLNQDRRRVFEVVCRLTFCSRPIQPCCSRTE